MHNLLTVAATTLALAASAQSATGGEMRSLTTNILAGITGNAPEPIETTEVETDALRGLVEQALSERQSDAYLEALIAEAADNGKIEVPDAMRTTTRKVDTRTLLASLVAKSEGASAEVNTIPQKAEAQSERQEDRTYVVVAGDNLSALFLTYNGTTGEYNRIFNANRDALSRPDLILIGQTLINPR